MIEPEPEPDTPDTTDTPPVAARETVVVDSGDSTPAALVTHPLQWWQIILIRATRAAIASLGGGSIAGLASGAIHGITQATLRDALIGAAGAFVWSALQNGAELLARLDQTNPTLRA